MDNVIKDRLNKLYSLAFHESTPEHEKVSAKNFLDRLMAKYGISDYSEFLTSGSDSNVTGDLWISFRVKGGIDSFFRNVCMIIGDYCKDTIIFNGDKVMCLKGDTLNYLEKILTRFEYHVNELSSLVGTKSKKADYKHGFVYGVYSYFSIKASEEVESNAGNDSQSLAVISQALKTFINDNDVSPVSSEETNMGKIKDQRIFLIGLKHGKEWSLSYLTK